MAQQPHLRSHRNFPKSLLCFISGLVLIVFASPITAQNVTTAVPDLQLYPSSTAPDVALVQASFGESISASGDILVSGEMNSPYSSVSSRIRILNQSGGVWSLAQSFNVFPALNLWVNVVATDVSGNEVIAGLAPSSDEPYTGISGFRIYQLIANKWTETAHVDVTASDGIARARGFGSSVAISGSWAAVGDAYSGTVSMYHASASGTSWSLQTVLQAQPSDPTYFGRAIALEDDELLVGIPGEPYYDEEPTNVGAVATFNLSGTTWSRGADLTSGTNDGGLQFGWTLARRGNLAVVGARGSTSMDLQNGMAFVFTKKLPSNSWTLANVLSASDAFGEDMLTQSIATDGASVVAGTAVNKAYLFTPDGKGGWSENRINSPVIDDGLQLVEFGTSVALSGDGNVLVGAPGDSSGGVAFGGSVYQFPMVSPSSPTRAVTMGNTHDREQFGAAIDSDGPLLAVGTPLASNEYGYNAGSVTVYLTDDSQSGLLRQLTMLAPQEIRTGDGFGDHLAVSNNRIAALSTYGYQVGTGPSGEDGSAYIYKFDALTDTVSLEQRIPHPSGNDFGWGNSVALNDNLLAVGATNAPGPPSPPGHENEEPDTGVVYLFERDAANGQWSLKQTLMVDDTVPIYSFGSALTWCGDRLVVGAAFDQEYPSAGGAAFIFNPNAGIFLQQTKIVASGPAGPPRFFGDTVACTRGGKTLAVGSAYGEAFVFEEDPAVSGIWSQTFRATIPQDNEADVTGLRFIQNTLYIGVAANGASEVGSVHTVEKVNGVWQLGRRFTSVNALNGDAFGRTIGTLGYALLASSPTRPVAPAMNVGKIEAFGNVFEIFASGFEQ